jgi:hypothetical protein
MWVEMRSIATAFSEPGTIWNDCGSVAAGRKTNTHDVGELGRRADEIVVRRFHEA